MFIGYRLKQGGCIRKGTNQNTLHFYGMPSPEIWLQVFKKNKKGDTKLIVSPFFIFNDI
jgi:hypothetical protein